MALVQLFGTLPWLDGNNLIDIVSLIYVASTMESWKVREAMEEDAWIRKLKIHFQWQVSHFREFIDL